MNPEGDHEAALAGICLAPDNAAALDDIAVAGITAEDFTTPAGHVVVAALNLREAGRPVDLYSLPGHLSAETLAALGGPVGLNRLVDGAPPTAHAAFHCANLIEVGTKRRLSTLAAVWREQAQDRSPVGELLARMREGIEAEEQRANGTASDLAGASLTALADSKIDSESILLGVNGVRYLCRGGSMLFVGPSGVGKSTASAQQDILWALGRPAFGIAPSRPLRIVTVQAENDKGDLINMACGIMSALNLSAEDRAKVGANTLYISHNASTGAEFLTFLGRVLRLHRPDILRIDPLVAYAGGDLTKPETIVSFCRKGLNRLATTYGCGVIACHHTPKMTGNAMNPKARQSWGAFDWQYAAAGGADLANWARVVLVIEPLSRDVFAFQAAKRWPGWMNAEGTPEHVRFFQHEQELGKVHWHNATAGDASKARGIAGRDKGPDLETLQDAVVALVKKPMAPSVLKEQIRHKMGLAKGKAETMLTMLTAEGGLLVRWPMGTYPQRWLVGTRAQQKAWESQTLVSQSSLSSQQDSRGTNVPGLSSRPPYRGGTTGQQDTGKVGRQTQGGQEDG